MRLVTLPNGVRINPEHVSRVFAVDVGKGVYEGWAYVEVCTGGNRDGMCLLVDRNGSEVEQNAACQKLFDEVCSLIEGPSAGEELVQALMGSPGSGVVAIPATPDWTTTMVLATESAVPLSKVTTVADTGPAGMHPGDKGMVFLHSNLPDDKGRTEIHTAYNGVDLSQPPINWTPGKDNTGAKLAFVTMEPNPIAEMAIPPLAEVHGIEVDAQAGKAYWIDKNGQRHETNGSATVASVADFKTAWDELKAVPQETHVMGHPVEYPAWYPGTSPGTAHAMPAGSAIIPNEDITITVPLSWAKAWADKTTFGHGLTQSDDDHAVAWECYHTIQKREAAVTSRQSDAVEQMGIDQRRRYYACKVCGNMPNTTGYRQHSEYCYAIDSKGGGIDFCDLKTPR